jgi:NTE family protein
MVGLVLAGGAARGAYEVGVLQYLVEDVSRALGADVPIEILSGTSVGALHACALVALADRPHECVRRLVNLWTNLDLSTALRFGAAEISAIAHAVWPCPRGLPFLPRSRSVVDSTALEEAIRQALPFGRIHGQIQAGNVRALAIAATNIATGQSTIFVDRTSFGPQVLGDRTSVTKHCWITIEHALASAAMPILFAPIEIEGAYYCDGGLRLNVPLAPAIHLGADNILVVSPRNFDETSDALLSAEHTEAFQSPWFLAGKALNAVLLDRIDTDLDRLEDINAILRAGSRRFGPTFASELNAALADEGRSAPLAPKRALLIRPSADIGRLASAFLREETPRRRRSPVRRILRTLADREGPRQADLVSYVLFDGDFAARLIELGRKDAQKQHDELCNLFSTRLQAPRSPLAASG